MTLTGYKSIVPDESDHYYNVQIELQRFFFQRAEKIEYVCIGQNPYCTSKEYWKENSN